MSQIIEIHNLYGNHDLEKKKPGYSDRVCDTYFCTDTQCCEELFPGLQFHESLILEDCEGHQLYLTHGHQADFRLLEAESLSGPLSLASSGAFRSA